MNLYDQIKEEGKMEGKIEGERKKTIEIVVKSYENGLSISMISNIMGLLEEEIKQILNTKNIILS